MSYKYLFFLIIAGALLSAFIHPYLIIAVLLAFLAVFVLARNLSFGLLILVFFFPYLGLVIDFGTFEALREVPYLKDINAPFIDLYGLVLFAAWVAATASSRWPTAIGPWRSPRDCFASLARTFQSWQFYLPFWLSGLISFIKVPSLQFAAAIKYFARPFTFFYLVFFAMPVSILSRIRNQESPHQSKFGTGQAGIRVLDSALTVFYWTGLLSALNGLLGLLFGLHADFPRATPFGLLGVSPLGANHNLLAETLIATAPAGLILGTRSALHPARYNWIRYGMFFQWAIALLTFARTAWIAIAVQAVLYVWLMHRGRAAQLWQRLKSLLLPLLALMLLLVLTTFSETVRGSTLTRLDQARITAFYFARAPLLGHGVGTFLPSFWQVKAFLLEYGEPLEAHGVLLKLAFEQGIIGLAAFGLFVGSILLVIWRGWKGVRNGEGEARHALLAALLIASGSLAYQLFNTTYYTSKLWIPMALAVAIARIRNNESGIREKIHNS